MNENLQNANPDTPVSYIVTRRNNGYASSDSGSTSSGSTSSGSIASGNSSPSNDVIGTKGRLPNIGSLIETVHKETQGKGRSIEPGNLVNITFGWDEELESRVSLKSDSALGSISPTCDRRAEGQLPLLKKAHTLFQKNLPYDISKSASTLTYSDDKNLSEILKTKNDVGHLKFDSSIPKIEVFTGTIPNIDYPKSNPPSFTPIFQGVLESPSQSLEQLSPQTDSLHEWIKMFYREVYKEGNKDALINSIKKMSSNTLAELKQSNRRYSLSEGDLSVLENHSVEPVRYSMGGGFKTKKHKKKQRKKRTKRKQRKRRTKRKQRKRRTKRKQRKKKRTKNKSGHI